MRSGSRRRSCRGEPGGEVNAFPGWHGSGGKGGIFDLGSHAVVLKAAIQDLDPVLVSYLFFFNCFYVFVWIFVLEITMCRWETLNGERDPKET